MDCFVAVLLAMTGEPRSWQFHPMGSVGFRLRMTLPVSTPSDTNFSRGALRLVTRTTNRPLRITPRESESESIRARFCDACDLGRGNAFLFPPNHLLGVRQ